MVGTSAKAIVGETPTVVVGNGDDGRYGRSDSIDTGERRRQQWQFLTMAMATVTATAGVTAEASTTTKEIDGYSNGNCDGNCNCVGDGKKVATTKAYLAVTLKA